ncbi:hypothetical protein B0H11DRAFT_1848900 [Mycena galericulata]|nr:hypothetical protein B0H11DRAFT_1848900 [Mycena galericulata]
MGQRHQVFIVARVVPHGEASARFRCVGAFHHQWSAFAFYALPLKAARRFMSLIKQKDNALIVKEELRAIQGKYGPGHSEPNPYSTFLLASAWCVDLEPPDYYASGVSFKNGVLEATMGSTEGDNNDGITVFDITDPTNPSYCFVSTFGLEASVSVPQRVPLSAEQYARAYYPVPSDKEKEDEGVKLNEDDVQAKIDSLRDERLMTLDVLAEAWPDEYELPKTTTTSVVEDTGLSNAFPSLADLSLEPALKHAIEIGDTEELEELVWLPGKAGSIKSILQGQNPLPDSALPLLGKVVQHEAGPDKTGLDFSGFPLSDAQIISLLTLLERVDVQILNLSHNPNLTIDGLRQILSNTKLRRITLVDTPISDEQIYQLLVDEPKLFHTVEALVHPALFSWQDPVKYPNRFAYAGLSQHSQHTACAASLAVFTPATIVQSLTDLISPIANSDTYSLYSITGSSLVPQAAFASNVRAEGDSWGDRHVHCFPAVFDTPFNGEGWLFAAKWSMYEMSASRYGFVCIDATITTGGLPKFSICDLGGFLKEMASEGRPLPLDKAVKILEEIFTKLNSKGAKLWTSEEFPPFAREFHMINLRQY